MKISKIFHFLYFSVLSIPLLSIPIFAIYSQNHEITDNELVVQESKVVDFNQQVQNITDFVPVNFTKTNENNYVKLTVDFTSGSYQLYKFYNLNSSHIYYAKFQIQSNVNCRFYCRLGALDEYVNVTANTLTTLDVRKYPNTNGNNEFNLYGFHDNSNIDLVNGSEIYVYNAQLFDLTQMFGEGNEPTKEQFNTYFPNSYYPYTESQVLVIDNYETVTYNDTDIVSQFLYSEYNFMDKYLPMYRFEPFNGIYSWISNTFFTGNAPIVFTIFYQWFAYWLFVSLCWLIFDVLMYVPLVVHRWLDKGALE